MLSLRLNFTWSLGFGHAIGVLMGSMRTETRFTSLLFILALLFTLSVPNGAQAGDAKPATHFLGIGVCPPWKPQSQDVCQNSVEAVANALKKRLGLDDKNTSLLINQYATTEGVRTKLAELAKLLGPADRLIIYAALHAEPLNPIQPARAENDLLVLWSEEKPDTSQTAISSEVWLTAHDFASLVHSVNAGQLFVMVDACESGAISPLFIHAHPDNDPARPSAVVTSAQIRDMANFSQDRTISLFSKHLAASLEAPEKTLFHSVKRAMANTRQAAIPICAAKNLKRFETGAITLPCRQKPTLHDPDDLLSKIALQKAE